MKVKNSLTKNLLVILLLTVSVIGYAQEDQKDNDKITRQSLENALNGGFVIGKLKGIELTLGGHIQADAIFDANKTESGVFFKPSEITIPSENYPRTLFNIKDSRFRLVANNTGEEIDKHLKVLLEVDFRNSGNAPRIRHAWLEYGKFGAGQTWSNVVDTEAFPNIILNTGGPNSFSIARPVQFRFTQKLGKDNLAFSIEDHQPNVTSPDSWDVRQVYPNLTASYKKDLGKSHLRFAALINPISYNNELQPNDLKTEIGYAASLTGNVGLGKDNIKFQAAYGSGYSGYLEDLNKLNTEATVIDGSLKTINLLAAWLFYEHAWSNEWTSTAGYGLNDLGNNANETAPMIDNTQMGVLNVQYQPINNLKFALEGIYGKRENYTNNTVADSNGDDIRIQFTTLFIF